MGGVEGTGAVAGPRAGAFAAEVEAALEGPVLRYSQRRRLLKAAARAGVGRFEANLIIAAVQHRRRAEGTGARVVAAETGGGGRDVGLWCAGLVAVVQATIAWGAWRVWCG